jgi:YVTN family beta-propeller protein
MTLRLAFALLLSCVIPAFAGQAPGAANSPDVAISHRDRFYTSDQFSNTVSVIDPADNKLLGAIRLGDPTPGNLSPLYRGQLLVHGMGFSPDHRTLAVVSIGSNSVTFIDTATNAIKHVAYVGRAPHEAFFTPDGKEVWVSIRGENYVAVLDGNTFKEKTRITVPNGPGMTTSRPTANMDMSAPALAQKPSSLPLPGTRSSGMSSRRAHSAPTSLRHLTAIRSG